jgi:hypothetical protein
VEVSSSKADEDAAPDYFEAKAVVAVDFCCHSYIVPIPV